MNLQPLFSHLLRNLNRPSELHPLTVAHRLKLKLRSSEVTPAGLDSWNALIAAAARGR